MRNVLIIYASRHSPMRASQRDHLWSFRRYARDCRCFYVNVAFAPPPEHLRRIDFDLVIFDWLFVGTRVDRDWFTRRVRQMSWLQDVPATKVVLPQDEFISMDLLCDLIREFGVTHVFSVAPTSEWPKLYRTVDPARVRFHRVLTGYLDEHVVRKLASRWQGCAGRRIDIGYRTVSTAIWGRFNLLKKEIGERFQAAAPAQGLTTDIRIGAEHFLLGDNWLRFLLSCKYTLGVEGGSSLLDWDGSLFAKISKYLVSHPNASFDELEGPCIPPGRDGEISVTAISPRNLEACMTGTCQVLLEGDYNGILLPGVHYIAVKKDYSNLDQVIATMKDELARQSIVARAYQDIVASGAWTYARFVQDLLDASLAGKPATLRSWPARCLSAALHAWMTVRDAAQWAFIFMYSRLRDIRDRYRSGTQHA
jgi:hypothetical protein